MHLLDDKLDLSYVHVLKIVPAKMEYSYKQHIGLEFLYSYSWPFNALNVYLLLDSGKSLGVNWMEKCTYLQDLLQTIF